MFNRVVAHSLDVSLAVDRLSERVDHTSEHCLPDRDRNDTAGALDRVSLLNSNIRSKEDNRDAVFFQIQRHAVGAIRELDKLPGHALLHPADTGDVITNHDDRSGLGLLDGSGIMLDLAFYDLTDFFRF